MISLCDDAALVDQDYAVSKCKARAPVGNQNDGLVGLEQR